MMRDSKPSRRRAGVFSAVVIFVAIIDAFLLAWVRMQYLRDHGYDHRPPHRAVAKPAPP